VTFPSLISPLAILTAQFIHKGWNYGPESRTGSMLKNIDLVERTWPTFLSDFHHFRTHKENYSGADTSGCRTHNISTDLFLADEGIYTCGFNLVFRSGMFSPVPTFVCFFSFFFVVLNRFLTVVSSAISHHFCLCPISHFLFLFQYYDPLPGFVTSFFLLSPTLLFFILSYLAFSFFSPFYPFLISFSICHYPTITFQPSFWIGLEFCLSFIRQFFFLTSLFHFSFCLPLSNILMQFNILVSFIFQDCFLSYILHNFRFHADSHFFLQFQFLNLFSLSFFHLFKIVFCRSFLSLSLVSLHPFHICSIVSVSS
jgi:hypothetical protein